MIFTNPFGLTDLYGHHTFYDQDYLRDQIAFENARRQSEMARYLRREALLREQQQEEARRQAELESYYHQKDMERQQYMRMMRKKQEEELLQQQQMKRRAQQQGNRYRRKSTRGIHHVPELALPTNGGRYHNYDYLSFPPRTALVQGVDGRPYRTALDDEILHPDLRSGHSLHNKHTTEDFMDYMRMEDYDDDVDYDYDEYRHDDIVVLNNKISKTNNTLTSSKSNDVTQLQTKTTKMDPSNTSSSSFELLTMSEKPVKSKKKMKPVTVIIEDASDSEMDEVDDLKSVWRNRRPSPGQWMEPVETSF